MQPRVVVLRLAAPLRLIPRAASNGSVTSLRPAWLACSRNASTCVNDRRMSPQILAPDNDRPFISDALLAWLAVRRTHPTRARPCNNPRNAHAKQKNTSRRARPGDHRRHATPVQCVLLNRIYALGDRRVNLCGCANSPFFGRKRLARRPPMWRRGPRRMAEPALPT